EVGARRMAAIGCGNGSRLIRLCRRYPDLIGVCVDISDAACRLAGDAVAEAGLEHRISVVCRDALSLTEDRSLSPKLVDVDTVTSFFMLHDLFTRYATPVTALRRLREAFPRAQTFLLAAPMLSE